MAVAMNQLTVQIHKASDIIAHKIILSMFLISKAIEKLIILKTKHN